MGVEIDLNRDMGNKQAIILIQTDSHIFSMVLEISKMYHCNPNNEVFVL